MKMTSKGCAAVRTLIAGIGNIETEINPGLVSLPSTKPTEISVPSPP